MEINVELFKQQYRLIEQKLKEISKLKHCTYEFDYFDYISIDSEDVILLKTEYGGNERCYIPINELSMSLSELQEIFNKQYEEKQNKLKQEVLEKERLEYERLKAKFENI